LIVGGANEKGVEVCPKECCYKLMSIDEIINGKVSTKFSEIVFAYFQEK
jgi:hypothetical protein